VLERIGSKEGRKWLVSRAAMWQAFWFAAAALVTLLNPYLDGIYRYFFIATNDPIARSLNIEWQGPTVYDGTGQLFFFNVLIFVGSIYFGRRRMRPTEILLVLTFGYLSLTSLRNVIWRGWVTAPIVAANFAAWAARRRQDEQLVGSTTDDRPRTTRIELPALNWAIAVILVGSALIFTPLWRTVNPLVPTAARSALSDSTPTKLADFIKSNNVPAPIFNYMEWGGYLEWELYPRYQMFIDGRFEARQVQVWRDYLAVARGRADWQQTLDRYKVKTLVLNKDFYPDLIPIVLSSGNWHKVYEDKTGIVFTR
jgi:hypothetical protein